MLIERLGYEFSPRMALRSESAFQIFCALVELYPPAKDKEWMFISGAARLMIKGKDNEQMRMLMDRLFSGEDSLWNPSKMSGQTFEKFMSHCFDSKRILKVPEMKVALLRVLDDQTHLGTLTIREESPESFTYVFEEGERNARIEDDLAHNFTIGQERELRRCDLAAHMFARVLAGRKKGPELQYHLLWSDEQRTAGLERLIQSVMD